MSSSRKKLTLNNVSVNIGCGSCRKSKLHNIFFHPKPKPKNPIYQKHNNFHHNHSSYDSATTTTSTTNTNTTFTTFSPNCYAETVESSSNFCDYSNKNMLKVKQKHSSRTSTTTTTVKGFGRVGSEGVAVEKDSEDPYLDFRHSMLQMILENEIYTKDGLRDLLNCFLQLNSPNHHGVIVRAFTEIWNGVFSVRSNSSPRFHFTNHKSRDF